MLILLKLWGIAMVGIGGYCAYALVDILFIKGKISVFSAFFVVICLIGILVGITLIYGGISLLKLKKKNDRSE